MWTMRASLLVLFSAGALASLPLPSYIRPCSFKLSDRKLSECALGQAKEVMQNIVKGDPKYNIPKMDPLYVDSMVVIDGKGPLGLQLNVSGVNLFGLPATIINAMTYRSNPQDITFVATNPHIHITAKYNVTGRVLLLPIVGQGNAVMDLKNLRIVYQFEYKLEKLEDGLTYFIPQPGARFDVNVDGMTSKMDDLFNGDKTLLETTNNFLNDNWREMFDSLRPSFTVAVSKVVANILNGILGHVPMKEAFTDFDED